MIFRIVAIIGVIILAALGLMLVFDMATTDEVKDMLIKLLWVVGIVTAASLLIGLVTKKPTL